MTTHLPDETRFKYKKMVNPSLLVPKKNNNRGVTNSRDKLRIYVFFNPRKPVILPIKNRTRKLKINPDKATIVMKKSSLIKNNPNSLKRELNRKQVEFLRPLTRKTAMKEIEKRTLNSDFWSTSCSLSDLWSSFLMGTSIIFILSGSTGWSVESFLISVILP